MVTKALAKYVFDKSKIEIVGNPTITEDGVASGFSTSNYINTTPVSEIAGEPFAIYCDFEWTSGQGSLFSSIIAGNTILGIALIINQNRLGFFCSSDGKNYDIANLKIGSTTLISNTKYRVGVIFDGAKYVCKLINLDTNVETVEFEIIDSKTVFSSTNPIRLGGRTYWEPLGGSIDLKQFKIYVDGQLVYSPTRPITYLEHRKKGFDYYALQT